MLVEQEKMGFTLIVYREKPPSISFFFKQENITFLNFACSYLLNIQR